MMEDGFLCKTAGVIAQSSTTLTPDSTQTARGSARAHIFISLALAWLHAWSMRLVSGFTSSPT